MFALLFYILWSHCSVCIHVLQTIKTPNPHNPVFLTDGLILHRNMMSGIEEKQILTVQIFKYMYVCVCVCVCVCVI